jgi:hypothetical protein
VPQSDVTVGASFGYEVTTLLPEGSGTFTTTLALNSSTVFVVRSTTEGVGLWAIPKSGGAPKFVAPAFGVADVIVADDAYVYWTDWMGIHSVPVEGGSPSLLVQGSLIGGLALDEVGALYWVKANRYGTSGEVHRMQFRVDATIASGVNANLGVAVDETYAYFTSASEDGTDHTIRRLSKKGGAVETIATTTGIPLSVQVDARSVYYVDDAGSFSVWSMSKFGGDRRLLWSLNSWGFPRDIAVSDFAVWWVWNFGLTSVNGLYRSNGDGTGFAAVDGPYADDNSWGGPRVDGAAVYYFHGGALLRRLK